jgi:lipopolysaccharide transport system permease protein
MEPETSGRRIASLGMAAADVAQSAPPVAHAGEPGAELVIRPPGRWGGLGLGELWAYRELLYFLCRRDVVIRYKQSLLGITWAVLQPLALALIFWLFFGRLAKVPSDGIPYPVFSLGALVAWNFVSQAVTQAAQSLVADANLLAKVYFPRLVVPIAKILSLVIDLSVALLVLAIFMAGYGIAPPLQILLLPLFLALGAIVAFGFGSFLAALNVKYRDVAVVVPLFVQMWLFLTPVVYPASLVGGAWKYVYAINPMVAVVSGARWALFDAPPPTWGQVGLAVAVALGTLGAAIAYFRRTERFFADIV